MEVRILNESDIAPALYGLGLSFGVTSDLPFEQFTPKSSVYQQMLERADKLAFKGRGHNEFLIHCHTEWEVKAPRYWWEQLIQYRFTDSFPDRGIRLSDLSESTMHTILERELFGDDFEFGIDKETLQGLNERIQEVKDGKRPLEVLKNDLPEGFLQTRVLYLNYLCLQNMYIQRKNHKLLCWQTFTRRVFQQATQKQWLDPHWKGW